MQYLLSIHETISLKSGNFFRATYKCVMETSATSCGSINQLIMHNVTPIYKDHEKLITESSLTAWVGEEAPQIYALLAVMIISSHLSGNWPRLGACPPRRQTEERVPGQQKVSIVRARSVETSADWASQTAATQQTLHWLQQQLSVLSPQCNSKHDGDDVNDEET